MNPYLYLALTGLLVAFGSFAFAAYNMARHTRKFLDTFDAPTPSRYARGDEPEESLTSGYGNMFINHMWSIVAMIFGGIVTAIGVVLAVLDYLNLL